MPTTNADGVPYMLGTDTVSQIDDYTSTLATFISTNYKPTAWTTYAPTLSGLTGNSTVTGSYVQIGKTVVCRFVITLGSSRTWSGSILVSLPVTAQGNFLPVPLRLNTFGGLGYVGASDITLYAQTVSGSYIGRVNLASGVPTTWAAGDTIGATFVYEAA